jgi:outer membrane protein assembly factor BamB
MPELAPERLPEHIGHYRLVSRLGSGGMGVVYLAYSPSGRKVAVKVVHDRLAADAEFRGRFRQEVAAARRVSGAFTAPVVDADPDAERPWMATTHIAGPTLAQYVKNYGPLPGDAVRRLAAGLAEALRDIHRAGVVHRDLKPGNVLLADDGPKVIDFGISRPTYAESELRTETGKLIGTPPFMAPEQFQRPRAVGPAADVFALGSVLVHASLGRGPFDSESPYLVAYQVVHHEPDLSGVPDELAPVVLACLAKDPAARPTPDELVSAVRPGGDPLTLSLSARALRARVPMGSIAQDTAAPTPTDEEGGGTGPGGTGDADRPVRSVDAAAGEVAAHSVRDSDRPVYSITPAGDRDASDAPTGVTHVANRPVCPTPPADDSAAETPGAKPRPRRRAPLPLAATAAAALLLAGAAAVGAGALGGGAHQAARPAHRTASPAPGARVWEAAVGGVAGAPKDRVRTARCAYGAAQAALFCVDDGVRLARVDAATGRTVWSVPGTPGEAGAAPVVAGGLVEVVSADGARLSALDPGTGRQRWTRNVAAYGGVRATVGDTVLLTAADGTVTALDAGTGRTRWSRRVPGQSRPSFSGAGAPAGTAYARTVVGDGAGTVLTVVSLADGSASAARSFSGDVLPVGGTGSGAAATAVLAQRDLARRTVAVLRWRPASTAAPTRVALPYGVLDGVTVVAGGTAYVLGGDGELVAAGPDGVRWRLQTAVNGPSAPVVAGRRLYFEAADGRLIAVDLRHGSLDGQTAPRLAAGRRGYLASQPAPIAVDGSVFGFSPNGTVFRVAAGSLAN